MKESQSIRGHTMLSEQSELPNAMPLQPPKIPKIFAVAQTDKRQAAAGRALCRAGYTVVGIEETARADYILLPLPLDDEHASLAQLLKAAKPGAVAFGGKIAPRALLLAQAANIELIDYFARPELAVLNAIPTAEGCIARLFAHRECTVWGASILVFGFGRVAKALAVRLLALGAVVTVAAREAEQRAFAESLGCKVVDLTDESTLLQEMQAFDTVVNTIPALVLTKERLQSLPENSLLIDLASRPGGIDFAAAKTMGHKAIHALSLPAECAPESAGMFVAKTVLEILAQRGE